MAGNTESSQYTGAILVASFGTSYKESMDKTIGAIEESIRASFNGYKVYRAFTSQVIKRKIEQEGLCVYNVTEALEAMIEEGVNNSLVVQPTYIINGIEYGKMVSDVMKYRDRFGDIKFGEPLLSSPYDYKELASVIVSEYQAGGDEAIVLMGHGSVHYANSAYPAFEYVLKDMGYRNIFVGTVEGYPGIKEVKSRVKECNIKKVCLVPMMIVAGDHVNNDMAGGEGSWRQQFEEDGYKVTCCLKGLGEIEGVQGMFIRHINEIK